MRPGCSRRQLTGEIRYAPRLSLPGSWMPGPVPKLLAASCPSVEADQESPTCAWRFLGTTGCLNGCLLSAQSPVQVQEAVSVQHLLVWLQFCDGCAWPVGVAPPQAHITVCAVVGARPLARSLVYER